MAATASGSGGAEASLRHVSASVTIPEAVDTLEAAGYKVLEASNAVAAINLLEARPDIRLGT